MSTEAIRWNRDRGPCVYVLVDPRDLAVRYVGKTVGYPNSRWRKHLREATVGRNHNHRLAWVRALLSEGTVPILLVVERPDIEGLADVERQWIAHLRAVGAKLVNATDGGEGMLNPSAETRAKLRQRPQVGFSPEAREAASKFLSDKWTTPEWRAAQAERNRLATAKAVERRAERAAERDERRRVAEAEREQAALLLAQQRAARAERRAERAEQAPKLAGDELVAFRVENARRMGARLAGQPKTPEHREKLAEALRRNYANGYVHPLKGTTASLETREKLRAAWERRKARG